MTHQLDNAPTAKAASLKEIMSSERFRALHAETQELMRLAIPLYKERLCSVPFYRDRMDDEAFWKAYIGSAMTEARLLVAAASNAR